MRGITVTLYDREKTGTDALNHPIYTETPVNVDNVLVAPMSTTEVLDTYNLTGRRAVYQLGIPKGDTHDWTAGKKVRFFDEDWRIIGMPTLGIEVMIPTTWNTKVQVERYEQG
ncbi:MAG: hypothetical protein IIZ78_12730 [Clostridiales bacterium]|nr:hypothetical protein [Clostridiales bacterium]